MTNQSSTALFILGMHRSGTSAFSGATHLAGCYQGEAPVATGPDNPSGFWEHPEVVALHEKFLASANSSWDDVSPLVPGWQHGPGAAWFRDELTKLLKRDFSSVPLWSVKDPRLCRLLPLWLPVLDDLGIRPVFVILSRNPQEVAASLKKRNQMGEAHAHWLWLQHMLSAEKETRGRIRSFTTYRELLMNPVLTLGKVGRDLMIVWKKPLDSIREELTGFVNPRLCHHRLDEASASSPLTSLSLRCSDILTRGGVCADEEFEKALDEIRGALGVGAVLLESETRNEALRQEVAALQFVRRKNEELEACLRSRDEGIWQLKGEVVARTYKITDLEKHIGNIEEDRGKLHEVIRGLSAEVEALQKNQIQELAAVRRIQSSFSWKLVSAIRQPRKLFSRVFRPKKKSPGLPAAGQTSSVAPSPGQSTPALESVTEPAPDPPLAVIAAPRQPGFSELTLLPAVSEQDLQRILEDEIPPSPRRRADIVSFSIVDWEFRYQRPQQMMAHFAREGHRVFYLSLTRLLPVSASPRFEVREIQENVFEVSLATLRPLDMAARVLNGPEAETILESLDEFRRTWNVNEAVAYVMIASWLEVALATKQRWGWKLLYDCMDEWETFQGIHPAIPEAEKPLVLACDLVITTARKLYEKWLPDGRPTLLVRNAVDIDFYANRYGPNTLLQGVNHPIIGFYGGIEDWFDLDLMVHMAKARPDYTFVLVGGVHGLDLSALEVLPNVHLCGLQPYERMPQYLYHFDVCIIPFKINQVTEATDPVKFYEYISWGKPVVSVDLPELEPYRDLLYLAKGKEDFVVKLDQALAENQPDMVEQRKAVARENSWQTRVRLVQDHLQSLTPTASIVIVTYGNLALTRLCLESLLQNIEYPNYEIIVVDNASTDGTPSYLKYLEQTEARVRVILNATNRGFSAANNQGLAVATGSRVVILNNDTIVPPGWLTRLLRHLDDPKVGLVGPRTNAVSNEARLEADYETWGEMEEFAARETWKLDGRIADISMLAMYCVAIRKEVFLEVGPLDEQFGVGMFEDDDYSVRVRQAGYRVVCAGDVFLHHFGQAAFKELAATGEYNPLFEENRRRYEQKWNQVWKSHRNGELPFEVHLAQNS